MVELLIVIAIIGVLGGISVVSYKGYIEAAERGIALDFVEQINNGLKEYEQNASQVTTTPDDSGAADESTIVTLLQLKDPTVFGSPFFRTDWKPHASDDSATYRIRWNGATFELLEPGSTGHGLQFNTDGSDISHGP